MEVTWGRIKALGKRLVDSRGLEIAMEMGASNYLVFTPDGKATGLESIRYQKGRTHRVTAKGPWDLECDCPDYQYNDHLNAGFCKHVMAVLEYRGHTPVLVKTLADTPIATEPGDNGVAVAARYEPEELERLIKELY